MYSSFFYRLTWGAQFAAGAVLFVISFLIEAHVLAQYLGGQALALGMAGALELSKALSIVLYRYMLSQDAVHYPRDVRLWLKLFRAALLGLSIVCSIMFLAERLDRPNLEPVRAADIERLEQDYSKRLARLQTQYGEQLDRTEQEVAARYRRLSEHSATHHQPAIEELEALLTQEMDYVVNGVFLGPRYKEIERRLGAEKARLVQRLSELEASEQSERARALSSLADRRERALAELARENQARLAAARGSDYRGDARVENPLLSGVLSVHNTVFGTAVDPLQFVFFFSIFLSVVIELGIVVIFEHITLSYSPLFQAEHMASLEVNERRIHAESNLRGAKLDDEAIRSQVDAHREHLERRLREVTARS